jgi:hypothetical protein
MPVPCRDAALRSHRNRPVLVEKMKAALPGTGSAHE